MERITSWIWPNSIALRPVRLRRHDAPRPSPSNNLRARLFAGALTSLSVALGVGSAIASILMAQGIEESSSQSATDYNLVVGAKGSPMQLVLGVVFRIDVATPNIRYSVYETLREDPRVRDGGTGDARRRLSGLPLRGDERRVFRRACRGGVKTSPSRPAGCLRDDPPDAPGLRGAARRGSGAPDRDCGSATASTRARKWPSIRSPWSASSNPTHSADDRAIFMSLASFWEMNEVCAGADGQAADGGAGAAEAPVRPAGPAPRAQRRGRDPGGAAERRDPAPSST